MTKYQYYKIDKPYKTIYYFLKDSGFSENYITNLRKVLGNIKVNDEEVTIRHSLNIGDMLAINSNPNNKTTIMQCIIPLDIVYEDKYYLLINKPSGLPCMPSRSHYTCNLAGAICYYMDGKEPDFTLRIVNRLDKDTAGIVIVAKDSISQKEIKNIKKTYYALCEGAIDSDLVIDKKIKTISYGKLNINKREVSDDGRDATTYVHPIKSFILKNNSNKTLVTLVKINLIHGRTHQIRVHLSSIGHPLLGDELYGSKSPFINHTALVCKEVSFFHPYENKTLFFSVPLPEDIEKLLQN